MSFDQHGIDQPFDFFANGELPNLEPLDDPTPSDDYGEIPIATPSKTADLPVRAPLIRSTARPLNLTNWLLQRI
ncbi:hypothetical protein LB505_013568 [Fusarium chuoi]|nr:hypothetical protein LB505_013568 [Fusarium chuoi]